ncbi:MAG TPA: DUF2845 domain-containing protein [Steroidobacteraceae bacterium]|nr:DUF2845 domain-containing protein [Steroidobacteraceae bacterium]
MKPSGVIYVLAALVPGVAACDEFRCGHWLVNSEISLAELGAKCGEPTSRKVSTQGVFNADGFKVGTSTIEVLRYQRGSRANAMIVTVVDGKVQRIGSEQ